MTEPQAELVVRIVLPALIGILKSVQDFVNETLVSLEDIQGKLDPKDAA